MNSRLRIQWVCRAWSSQNGRVFCSPQDLLEPEKRSVALAVQKGNIDIKYPEQAVGNVFLPCRVPPCGPGHALRDGKHRQRGSMKYISGTAIVV